MSAYLIMRIQIQDAEKLKAYQQVAPKVIEQYGGKLLVRGGDLVTLEGASESRRIVVIEFPDQDQAQAFYHSPEYTEAIQLRTGAADFEIISVEGVS